MIVVYVSVWPFIVFGWKEERCADSVTDGWKGRRSKLQQTARSMVCRKLNARSRKPEAGGCKDRGQRKTERAEPNACVENFGHVHTITKRLELPELGEGVECFPGEGKTVLAQDGGCRAGIDMDFELDDVRDGFQCLPSYTEVDPGQTKDSPVMKQ